MITQADFIERLKRARGKQTQKQFAEQLEVSFQFIYKVLKGKAAPGAKLAAALGYKQVVVFEPLPIKRSDIRKAVRSLARANVLPHGAKVVGVVPDRKAKR